MASLNFDATTVEPQQTFSPIPAGLYAAQVIDSDVKSTKSGTGQYIQLTWQVLDGDFKGRLVFDRLNIRNQNATAEKIGQQQLSGLCHALGVLKVQDTAQLHGKPCRIKVSIRKDDQYGDSNEIKGYEAIGKQAPISAAAPAQGFSAPPTGGAQPPWMSGRAA